MGLIEFFYDWIVDFLPFRVWLIFMAPLFLLLAWFVLAYCWPQTFGLG